VLCLPGAKLEFSLSKLTSMSVLVAVKTKMCYS